jgi:hypothetical protein
MEKFNMHNDNSNCTSDTDSQDGDNQFLIDFIFDKCKFQNGKDN